MEKTIQEPNRISFEFHDGLEVVYTFTGDFNGIAVTRPVYQVAVFDNKKRLVKSMGTYWGLVNKTSAIAYIKRYNTNNPKKK